MKRKVRLLLYSRNLSWLLRNESRLAREHAGKYVAISNRTVITSADTASELQKKLTEFDENIQLTALRWLISDDQGPWILTRTP